MDNFVVNFRIEPNVEMIFGPFSSREEARQMIFKEIQSIQERLGDCLVSGFSDIRSEDTIVSDKKTKKELCKFKIFTCIKA